MKRLIVITLILLAAAIAITVVYFKNLSPPGVRTGQVMHTIPEHALPQYLNSTAKRDFTTFLKAISY
jgi:hypothetical protein